MKCMRQLWSAKLTSKSIMAKAAWGSKNIEDAIKREREKGWIKRTNEFYSRTVSPSYKDVNLCAKTNRQKESGSRTFFASGNPEDDKS